MAPTEYCPECGQVLYADEETYKPMGTDVVYVCRNGGCESVKRGFPYKVKKFVSN
jgi:DNA-directed RNA polymerase subunit M/transcription elongation factor TFIIS